MYSIFINIDQRRSLVYITQASHSASKDLKDSSSKNKGQLSEIKDLKDKILTTAKRWYWAIKKGLLA